ncbi:MAG: hypothetical protein AAGE96_01415 [Cyanobacteria bacterium P01_G01_bin.19]
MKTTNKILFLASISTILFACGGNKQVNNQEKVEEGVNINNNPLGVLKKVTEAGNKYQEIQEQITKNEPVNPIHFKDLISLLPKSPSGWEAEEAQGETNTFGEYSISQASRSYKQEDRTIEIRITDWAYNTGLYAPFLISADFSQESSQGYNKGIKIGDVPGREEYTFNSKKGTLSLLAEQRFFIEIEGNNIESQELQEWWGLIDKKEISQISN